MKRAALSALVAAFLFHLADWPVAAREAQQPLNYFKTIFVTGDFVVDGIGLNDDGTGDITINAPALVGKDVVAAFLYWQAITRADTPDAGGVGAYFKGNPLNTAQGIFAKGLGPGTPTCGSGGGGAGNSQGAKKAFTYRMDVLRYFDVDQNAGANFGKLAIHNVAHSVQLPISNNIEPIGASLVVVYRDGDDLALPVPLRAVTIYDGSYAMDQSTNGMQLTMKGFYDGTPGAPAKLAIIGGNGQNNKSEITRFNDPLAVNPPLATNAFSSSEGPKWDNPTFSVVAPTPVSGYADEVKVSVAQETLGTFDCVTFAAAIYSTPVNDGDNDGLLNRWEESATPLFDPHEQPLLVAANGSATTLSLMGADPTVPDVFVEINYMQTGPPGGSLAAYSYGGVSKPAHSHMPGPDALKRVGDAFKGSLPTGDRIRIHFDIGNLANTTPYQSLEGLSEYLVPAHLARGGEALDEWTTVCERLATDPEYVCQFGYTGGVANASLAFPGSVGWKTGFRFYRDAVSDIEPNLPNNLPAGETEEDYCDQLANANTGQRYVCERRFDEGRFNIFRYMLFSHHVGMPKSVFACLLNGEPVHPNAEDKCANGAVPNPDFHVPVTSSGIGDFPGGDAEVTLGAFLDGTGKPVGTQFQQAGTIMHELGHQFLRRHGGGAFEPNCKPTYLSVMNYLYQLRGLLKDDDSVELDFSYSPPGPTVNEAGLQSNVDHPDYRLGWLAPLETSYLANNPNVKIALRHCNGSERLPNELVDMVRVDAPTANTDIDWDADGNPATILYPSTNPGVASQDVNYSGGLPTEQLQGSADWPNLRLNQLGIRRNVGALYLDPDTNLFTVGPTSVGLGKGDAGKGDAGVQDLGKGDAGKGDAGKGDAGKGDAGKGDAGKGDAGKGDAGTGDTFSNDPTDTLTELDAETAGDGVLRRPTNFEACVFGVDCAGTGPIHDVGISFVAPTDANPVSYTVFRVPGAALLPEQDWVTVATIPHVVGTSAYSATDDTSGLADGAEYTYFARANYDVAEGAPVVIASSDITRRVTITVIDDPALAVNHEYSTNEDTPLVVAAPGILDGSGDPDDPVAFTAELVSGPSTGTLVLNGNGSFTYTPPLNFSSATPVTFTYRAVSESTVTNTATVSITVNSVNDLPTISNIADQTIILNTVLGPIAFTLGDVDSDPTTLTVSGESSNTTLVPNANIVFGGAGLDRTITVTPAANATGMTTITVRVRDAGGATGTDTFVLTVTPPPTLVGIQNVPPPANKQFNRGSTIPMVWQYHVGSTAVDSSLVRQTVSITGPSENPQVTQTYSCTNQTPTTPCTDSGSSFFRYDATTRRWSFNLQTKTPAGVNYAAGTYTVTIAPLTPGYVGTSFTVTLK